jgi:hypothetical protein
MKSLDITYNEAVAEGIKGPITGQFRDSLSEYKALIRRRQAAAIEAVREIAAAAATAAAEIL